VDLILLKHSNVAAISPILVRLVFLLISDRLRAGLSRYGGDHAARKNGDDR
jgi:hypothetical protein